MSYQLTDQERQAVAALPADQRYDYFTTKVAEWEQIWSLRNVEGWVVVSSDDGEECMPVWPHADFAAEWATGDWDDCSPAAVPLDVWLARWTPGMEKDGSMVAIFPSADEEGVVVTPTDLRDSLHAELEKNGKAV
jgi:hypothetical protein